MDSLDDLTPQKLAALFEEDFTEQSEELSTYPLFRPSSDISSIYASFAATEQSLSKAGRGRKRASKSSAKTSCSHDHLTAERRRREKLSQQFIALSAMVPGLKRMDKVSVLGDCMKYIRHLQERLKTLEQQTSNGTAESAVFVKKYHLSPDTERDFSHEPLPEIEARVSDRNVMIKIHCEKHTGVVAQILSAAERFHLRVISSCVIPFGSSTFDITVMAQMEVEFNMTVNDLVKKLRSFVVQFMRKNMPQDQNVCL
ncbi:hypothetical protein ACHQM5_016670 [Ranunculus cassubicifolius]